MKKILLSGLTLLVINSFAFAQKNKKTVYLNPNSELYKDLEDIAQRKISQQIKYNI